MVNSILKALDILEFVSNSDSPVTVTRISETQGINRTTVFRLVQTLAAKGYLLKKDAHSNGYQLGLKVLPMAAKLLDNNRLRVVALPLLQELAQKCKQRVNLGILDEGEVLYLGGLDKPSLPMMYSRFGKKAPAHCCSLGKIIMAYLPEDELDDLLDKKPLIKQTENTITDREVLKQHLAEIRSQGYAIDNREHAPDVYCLSALIRDSAGQGIGAISISSHDLEKAEEHLNDLLIAAEIISHSMGYSMV